MLHQNGPKIIASYIAIASQFHIKNYLQHAHMAVHLLLNYYSEAIIIIAIYTGYTYIYIVTITYMHAYMHPLKRSVI